MTTHAGSCHCGQIAFEVDGEFPSAMVCNCSYCRRAGYMLAFTTPDKFRLKTPKEDVSTYLFNQKVINHHFCANCGIATHGSGTGPDGKPMVAVNLRCVPDIDLDALQIQKFDGAKL
jgi:hypothetical protein